MHTLDARERRTRLAARHHLAPGARAATPEQAAADLVGLHASDPTSVYLQAFARVESLAPEELEAALYERRTLLRFLGMRRTMFVVPRDLAAVMQAACLRTIGARERRRLVAWLASAGIGGDDAEAWLNTVEAETVAAFEQLGEATAAELTDRVPGLREQIPFGEGKTWQGTVGVSTRILFLLAAEGRIIRGRPRGTRVSSLYRWAPLERWIGGRLPEIATGEAQANLVRRWIRAFGPGTERDLAWWTGLTLGETRRALAGQDPPVVEVALEGGAVGLALADDLEPTPDPGPWTALLPGLDATTMGWADRRFFLGGHGPLLFDRNGNAGPTVWVDGRVVGGWAHRPNGEIVAHLLEDVGTEARASIDAAAARLEAWLGPTRIIPRFRTPLEKDLSG